MLYPTLKDLKDPLSKIYFNFLTIYKVVSQISLLRRNQSWLGKKDKITKP